MVLSSDEGTWYTLPPFGIDAVPTTIIDHATPLLKAHVRALFRQLPQALAGDEEAIHQMRVAGRRLRVALPLLARKPHGRRVRRGRRILRELTRSAGTSRDLDVGVGLFEERLKERGEIDPERRTLRQRLRSARGRSRVRMAEALMDIDIARVRRDLRVVVSRRAELVFTALLRLRDARDVRGTVILESLATLGESFEPAALHRLRIRLRRLRYAAELAEKLTGQTSEAPALFRQLQDELGRVRDAHVLSCWLGRQAGAAAARGQAALAAAAREEEAFFLERSHEHHRAFLALSPAATVRHGLEAMGASRTAA
jgi:CHAD domain-containing protein